MDWKKTFDKKTLSVGKRFLDKGYVREFTQTGEFFRAKIKTGKEEYCAEVKNPGEPDMKLRCSCYFAFSGFKCYHMAALMFCWERETIGGYESGYTKAASRFPGIEEDKEPYFYVPDMLDEYYVGGEEYKEALEMIEKGDFKERKDFETAYNRSSYYNPGQGQICLKGYFKYKDKVCCYDVDICVYPDEISSVRCGVCGRYINKNKDFYYNAGTYGDDILCAHMMAALILTDKHTRLYDPGDSTDKTADTLLGYFMREREYAILDDEKKETGNVVLIPRISYEGRTFEVSFKIGNGGRFYIVKSILELYNAVKNHLIYTLGKNCEIDFARETFDERSSGLFDMIEAGNSDLYEMYTSETKAGEYYSDPYGARVQKSIFMTGQLIDYIYDNFKGEKLEFKDIEGFTDVLTPADSLPVVEMFISPVNRNGKHSAIEVSGNVPVILKGVYHRYSLKDGILCRVDENMWADIRPFYEVSDKYDGSFGFEIGNKKATEFYYNILSELKENPVFHITEDEKTASDIMPGAEFIFYLDVDNGCIICKAKARYDTVTDTIVPYRYEELPLPAYRDSYREEDIRKLLNELFETYDPESKSYCIKDDDMKYEFMKEGVRRLISRGETQGTESFNALKIRRSTPVTFGVSIESDLLNLDIKTEDMEPEELLQILDSYKKKKRYHRLRNGDFVELEGNDSLGSLLEMTSLLGVDADDYIKGHLQIPAYRALYLDKMLEEHDELAAERDKNFKSIIKNFKTINESESEVPACLKDTLRSYQEYGYKWLKTLENAGFGGILADDMGLGKTLQLIALLEASKEEEGVNAIVICPASLVYNWIEEFKKFAPSVKTAPLAGTKPERKRLLAVHRDFDVLVTSYDLLKRDIDLYEGKTFTHQILDEAQYIKNARAQAAKSVKLIKAKHRFALTGTPIENRLSELWSIFDFLMPGFLYGYERFRTDFEVPITKNGDEKAMEGLRKMVSPFLLRRKKSDVLKDLPDKLEEVLYAGMETKQRRLYDAQVAKIVGLVESQGDAFDKNKIAILAEITKTRQICCDPGLLFENYDGDSAKRLACMELVQSVADGGHKMLLFSQFTSMLELLEEDLKKAGLSYYKITGSTPKEERVRLVNEFNGDDTPVFLISLKAGGTGLNLTGADIVIHYDPWWNTAAQDQATDRAHRIGQTKKVTVYRIIAKDTIEEKILQLQETKKELADSVLSGETRSLGSMTKEELLEILGE